MTIPVPTFGATGFIAPTEADILAGVQSEINAAFGGNLNPALNTPQGQLASSMAGIIGNVDDTFVFMTNMMNPAFAFGRWQDGIGYIYFLTRNPALPTVVQATCSGLAGIVIPDGSTSFPGSAAIAQAADGNVYTCTTGCVIGVGGTGTAEFTCNVAGAIACPAHSLTTIYQSIVGWDSIDNGADGVIGQNVESRSAFEARRFQSVAHNSVGALPSVLGAILSVPSVLDAYVTENPTAAPVTVGGVTLNANSLYVAVVGGTSTNVANAIWTKKAPGCAYYSSANTSVTVYDTNYDLPYPSYVVKYEIPAPLEILFAVNIANNAQVPANATALIQAALISAFAGGDGGPRARIGSAIYASRFYGVVAALGSWVQIISIQIGCQNDSDAAIATGCTIAGTTLTLGSVTAGTWAIGQTVVDATGTILPGTVIQSGSGTSWVVNLSQTVASETMYGITANQNDVLAQINQSPVLDTANIVVTAT